MINTKTLIFPGIFTPDSGKGEKNFRFTQHLQINALDNNELRKLFEHGMDWLGFSEQEKAFIQSRLDREVPVRYLSAGEGEEEFKYEPLTYGYMYMDVGKCEFNSSGNLNTLFIDFLDHAYVGIYKDRVGLQPRFLATIHHEVTHYLFLFLILYRCRFRREGLIDALKSQERMFLTELLSFIQGANAALLHTKNWHYGAYLAGFGSGSKVDIYRLASEGARLILGFQELYARHDGGSASKDIHRNTELRAIAQGLIQVFIEDSGRISELIVLVRENNIDGSLRFIGKITDNLKT